MDAVFVDTSALTKLYVSEPGTPAMLALRDGLPARELILLSLTAVELRSAVRRRQRFGDLQDADAARVLHRFEQDVGGRFRVIPIGADVLFEAAAVIDRNALRAGDALQLAGALLVRSSVAGRSLAFAAADFDLLSAAAREGLRGYNPEVGDPERLAP